VHPDGINCPSQKQRFWFPIDHGFVLLSPKIVVRGDRTFFIPKCGDPRTRMLRSNATSGTSGEISIGKEGDQWSGPLPFGYGLLVGFVRGDGSRGFAVQVVALLFVRLDGIDSPPEKQHFRFGVVHGFVLLSSRFFLS
jgi:hypothetical protein